MLDHRDMYADSPSQYYSTLKCDIPHLFVQLFLFILTPVRERINLLRMWSPAWSYPSLDRQTECRISTPVRSYSSLERDASTSYFDQSFFYCNIVQRDRPNKSMSTPVQSHLFLRQTDRSTYFDTCSILFKLESWCIHLLFVNHFFLL